MPGLKRHIGTFEALFYGLGVIIGAGIYVLVAPASGFAGNAVWLSFALAATLATFTGLGYAELGSMFPKSAAEYVYLKRAYRSHLYAFMIGWSILFTGIISISTVSLGFTGYIADLLSITQEESIHIVPVISIGMIAAMGLINYLGLKHTNRANLIMTSVVITGLLIIIGLAFFTGKIGSVDYFFMPNGLDGVFLAASLIFFAYLGFEEIVNVAEETKNPKRVLPKSIVLAVVVSTALYMGTAVSLISLEGWDVVSKSSAPLASVAGKYLGHGGELLLSGIALFATSSTVLALTLVVSRMIWGMSRDGALPRLFSRINKTGVPDIAILTVCIGAAAMVFLGDIGSVASITSAGALIAFLNINAALIWLRFSQPRMYRPFKVPINIGKFPVLGGLGVAVSLFMLAQFDLYVLAVGALVTAAGGVVFLIYKRREYTIVMQTIGIFKDIASGLKEGKKGSRTSRSF